MSGLCTNSWSKLSYTALHCVHAAEFGTQGGKNISFTKQEEVKRLFKKSKHQSEFSPQTALSSLKDLKKQTNKNSLHMTS